MVLDKVKNKVKRGKKHKVGLFVDGPNIIRKEFNINLDKLRERVEGYGRIVIGKVFLNQFASEKLIEAIANQGFEPVIALGGEEQEEGKSDVDVSMAVAIMEAVYRPMDIIVIVTRDADFLPVIQKAKEMNKEVIVMAVEEGLSTALKNAADKVELIG
ncbi:MAG: TIGR00288 family NYN domain-containing protein [Candidatus Aenigmatarchaeota archaeon]